MAPSSDASRSPDSTPDPMLQGVSDKPSDRQSGEFAGFRPRIMVVADGLAMRRLLWRTLKEAGFELSIVWSDADIEAEAAAVDPNMVIADVTSPLVDRFAIVEHAQRSANVPVVLIGQDTGELIASALRGGADEYILAPFSPAELVARVEAVYSRGFRNVEPVRPDVFVTNGLRVDFRGHGVSVDGYAVKLTATEFHLLAELASSPGRVFSTPELLRRVWGESHSGTGYLVRSVIRATRAKLGDDPAAPRFIKTLHGIGYMLLE